MIVVEGIHKRFKLYHNPADRLKEILFRRPLHRTHVALEDLSFRLEEGETLGVIGRNGAGKSTLLKILAGVLLPDSGEIQVDGRITGLLELGTGFDYALDGRENIYNNGLLLGMTPEQIARRREAIVEFAELAEYIDEPLRTYSSGMVMRLAFAIAIHADPRCFLIDEALSVGDARFQQKCMRRIKRFRAQGGAILFVSHDLNAVKTVCDRVLVLEGGRIAWSGLPEGAVNYYNRLIAEVDEPPPSSTAQEQDYGTGEVRIVAARLWGEDSGSDTLSAGERLHVEIDIRAQAGVGPLTLGILIRDRFGQDIFGTNTYHLGQSLCLSKGETLTARFHLAAELAPGQYSLTVAAHSAENHLEACYHWRDNLLRFQVAGVRGPLFTGLCRLPVQFDRKESK